MKQSSIRRVMRDGPRTEERGLHEEIVTKSNYVIKEDITGDIPCPWYKCLSLLNIFQLRSHYDQHRKYEHKLQDVITYSDKNRSYGDKVNKDKYDASEKRSNNQSQRILSTMPQLSQRSFQDNIDLKTKKISDILVSFRPKPTQEYESESGTDSSVSTIKKFYDFSNKKTTTKADLKKHKICVHSWIKSKKLKLTFNCNECDFQAAKESQLKLNKMSMHEEVQNHCDANDNQSRRHGHLPRNTRSSPVKYKRDECNSRETQIGNNKLLKLNVHEGLKHKCDVCSYQTTNSSNFKRHIQSIHEGIKFNCDKCCHQFTTRDYLKRHIQSVHKGIKYNCETCSSQFTTRDCLKKHRRSVHKGLQYNCDECSSQFTRIRNLRLHILGVHEGVKYDCDKCSSQFTLKGNLMKHIQAVHEGVKFNCDQCSSHFTSRGSLKRHRNIIHIIRAFKKM